MSVEIHTCEWQIWEMHAMGVYINMSENWFHLKTMLVLPCGTRPWTQWRGAPPKRFDWFSSWTVVVFLKFVGQVEETKCGRRNLLDVWRPHWEIPWVAAKEHCKPFNSLFAIFIVRHPVSNWSLKSLNGCFHVYTFH